MPNRIIKESIRTSRKLNALSDFQFRLWAYLVTYVDDYGRGSADPQLLKGFVFPRREVSLEEISAAMERLEQAGCILRYQAQDEWFFCFPHWSDHQRVQTKRSKFPPPPQEDTVGHGGPPPESESKSKSVSLSESGSGFESKGNPWGTGGCALPPFKRPE